jgi:hypothetical protein
MTGGGDALDRSTVGLGREVEQPRCLDQSCCEVVGEHGELILFAIDPGGGHLEHRRGTSCPARRTGPRARHPRRPCGIIVEPRCHRGTASCHRRWRATYRAELPFDHGCELICDGVEPSDRKPRMSQLPSEKWPRSFMSTKA